jgi:hypothetical protein
MYLYGYACINMDRHIYNTFSQVFVYIRPVGLGPVLPFSLFDSAKGLPLMMTKDTI